MYSIAEHDHFTPLGPELMPICPICASFSCLRIDHTVSGFDIGSEEEKALQVLYERLAYNL